MDGAIYRDLLRRVRQTAMTLQLTPKSEAPGEQAGQVVQHRQMWLQLYELQVKVWYDHEGLCYPVQSRIVFLSVQYQCYWSHCMLHSLSLDGAACSMM